MKLRPNDEKITFKRRFYLKFIYRSMNKLLKISLADCDHVGCSDNQLPHGNKMVDIITIAFNNTHVLQHQINLIKKNIKDEEISYIVADNSTKEEMASEIKKLCVENSLGYIRLPKNKWLDKRSGSYSHGAAMNWLYYNYVDKRKPDVFGFLDHDIYPLEKLSFVEKLGEQGFYGYRRKKGEDYWYIWPGLAVFKYDVIKNVNVNFAPCMVDRLYLDTGSSLFPVFYRNFDVNKIKPVSFSRFPLTDIGYENDSLVEFIDEKTWFHSANASYWRGVNKYEDIIDDIIEKTNN